jgi:hypothetical protein
MMSRTKLLVFSLTPAALLVLLLEAAYDRDGFRNPDLEDWQVVVIGDSLTEQGYLPEEDLFTS